MSSEWGSIGQGLGGRGEDASDNTNFQGDGPFVEGGTFGLGIHLYFCLSMSFFMDKSFLKIPKLFPFLPKRALSRKLGTWDSILW